VDLVGPIPQAFRAGLGAGGSAVALLVPFAIFAVTARTIANSSVIFTATTRMPMVAGWDRLLPAWFVQLHSRYRTPVNSILFIGACAIAMAAVGLFKVGEQEAFQLIDNAAGIFYGLTYLVLFAIPMVGLRRQSEPVPRWLRIACAVGFAVTALYVVFTLVPIVTVVSRVAFALKIGTMVVGANVIGAAVYFRGRRLPR
jgi:amino acid transporter